MPIYVVTLNLVEFNKRISQMNDNYITNVKDRVKYLIKERGMSIYELANVADISEACIRNWYGKRNYVPSIDSLQKICEVLNVSMAQLFVDEKEEFYPVNEELKDLIINWQKLDSNKKELILSLIKSYIRK